MPPPPKKHIPSVPETENRDIQTVAFVSLGCPKNLVDSEKMLGLLAEDGLIPVDAANDAGEFVGADAVVINTCGFLEASKIESVDEINQAIEAKKQGLVQRVVVTGCLVQRHRAKLLDWCPDIDAMIGVYDRDRVVEAVRGPIHDGRDVAIELPVFSSIATNATLAKQQRAITEPGYFESDASRLRLTPRHYAYLRMSEGCNQNCAFCTIPSIRGKMRSKPVARIVDEMRELCNDGAFEINLIGQDTTSYGTDIGYEPGLVGLLESVNAVANEFGGGAGSTGGNAGGVGGWIRLMYAYPSYFTDEMIDAIARLSNVVKYIDMPLQHINDRVLDSMRRNTSQKLIETLLDKLRDRVPGIAIRTTFISGFPGETQAEHDQLVAFVRDAGFEAMGVFPYSPEPGTPAGSMHADAVKNNHAISQETIDARIEALMLTQQAVVFARNDAMVSDQFECDILIDSETESKNESNDVNINNYVGRTATQAPDIDAVTHIATAQSLTPGELVRCRITGSADYDLIATPMSDIQRRVGLPILR